MSTHLFVKNLPLSLEKLQLSSPNVVTHNSAATGFIKDKSVIIIIVYVKLSEVVGWEFVSQNQLQPFCIFWHDEAQHTIRFYVAVGVILSPLSPCNCQLLFRRRTHLPRTVWGQIFCKRAVRGVCLKQGTMRRGDLTTCVFSCHGKKLDCTWHGRLVSLWKPGEPRWTPSAAINAHHYTVSAVGIAGKISEYSSTANCI